MKLDFASSKRKDISNEPKIVDFSRYSPSETYNMTQCSNEISDGDVFICSSGRIVGYLSEAWPVILYGAQKRGVLHHILPDYMEKQRTRYPETFRLAEQEATRLGLNAVGPANYPPEESDSENY